MKIKTSKSNLKGQISIPASKSHTIRAICAGMMADGKSQIINPLTASDTLSCLNASIQMGAEFKKYYDDKDNLVWEIEGTNGALTNKNDKIIDLGNSGTSLRLLTGIAATSDVKFCFDGDNSLRGRPLGQLISALKKLGVRAGSSEGGKCPIAVRGPIKGGETNIDGTSSQFVSSLLFATPFAKDDTEINVTNLNEIPYLEMTLDWLNALDVEYSSEDNLSKFYVKGNQKFKNFKKHIPADFSTATFPLIATAISDGDISIRNLDFKDKQGDKKIFELLKKMGMNIRNYPEFTKISKTKRLMGDIEIDLNSTPDALPAMAVLACFIPGKTVLNNVSHARFKETDRIVAMSSELRKMGAEVEELDDGMIIRSSELYPASVNGYNDHRIIMALSIAGMGLEGETVVYNADAVSVTYPGFVQSFKELNANIEKV